jgi:protein-L-isoaspartate(D-aspartate) O-methyltransferase
MALRARGFPEQRERMVERQLRRRGISDERVLAAMAEVPRERFVPEHERRHAYADGALPIGHEQTISQPWIVAAICQALELKGDERVLEIGTGSGYSACVLARLAAEVVTIERIGELAAGAREVIGELGVDNVEVLVDDGTVGRPARAPYAGIAVHATAPAVPESLIDQLDTGGRLVIPISTDGVDMLTVFTRTEDGLDRRELGACRFVPLIGREGFEPPDRSG